MQPVSTPITIRALAFGGKFIGGGVNYAQVEITDKTGTVLASGTADQGLVPGTDGSGITALIMDQPYPWGFPVRSDEAVGFSTNLSLTTPEVLTFTVKSTIDPQITSSVSRVVIPGVPLTGAAAVVVVLQGLLANLVVPTTPPQAGKPATITAEIRMMCGCKIDNLFWPAANFTVTALIGDKAPVLIVPLSYAGTPSLFSAEVTFPTSGTYPIAIQATEINGNLGAAAPVSVTVS